MSIKIDFIYLGAPRAGSTWLYYCLREHSQICVPKKKEIHLFDEDYNLEKFSHFEQNFSHCLNGQIKGLFPVTYLANKKIPLFLKKNFPKIKIIVCLRNPIERAYSHYWIRRAMGKIDKSISFEEAMKLDYIINMGFYYSYLKTYFEIFPHENILVTIYEDIQDDSLKFIQKVFRFLEVDDSLVPQKHTRRIHPSVKSKLRSDFLNTLIHKSINFGKLIKKRFSGGVEFINFLKRLKFDSLINFLKHLNLVDVMELESERYQKPPLNPDTVKYLQVVYKDDINKLENLINRDLSFWRRLK